MKKVAIIGVGVVGGAHSKLFPDAVLYDKAQDESSLVGKYRQEVNSCDVAFVCVPTNLNENGELDTSIVEKAVGWLETPLIIIRSTLPVGTTDKLKEKYKKRIVFQPEYIGETPAHPLTSLKQRQWLILGGEKGDCELAVQLYHEVYNSQVRIHITDAKTAELAKLMENAWIGTKVVFCNKMFDIARANGIYWNELRELWLADPRISRYYTFVFRDNRGFSGKCLPKDISSLANLDKSGFFKDLLKHNDKLRETNLGD